MTVTILGVGDSGSRILDVIAAEKLAGVVLAAVNTHAARLGESPDYRTLVIGQNELGAGGHPGLGKRAAEDSLDDLYALLQPASRLLIVGGFGGGTATGAAPVIARYARQLGLPVSAVISRPFRFEGDARRQTAEQYLPLLRAQVDVLAVVNSDDLLAYLPSRAAPSMQDAFSLLDRVMAWHVLVRVIGGEG
jgi:cell division protein FtsZ